eukprot:SAG31_NODE_1024_length_10294_cov_7.215400_12_plen_31_part_00
MTIVSEDEVADYYASYTTNEQRPTRNDDAT